MNIIKNVKSVLCFSSMNMEVMDKGGKYKNHKISKNDMEYTTNTEFQLIEILKKYSFLYSFKFLERSDLLFLPIQFSVKQNYDFYPCIFGFYAQMFEEELVKNLFNYQAANLEAIDKKNFIVYFAFSTRQRLI